MKTVYCENCGMRLRITRKAMPKFGTIIDLVEYHECPDEPVEFDLTPVDVPTFVTKTENQKFVQKLNELQPPSPLAPISTKDLQDRRNTEHVKDKSSAPPSLLQSIKAIQNTIPAHDLKEMKEPEEPEE